MLRLRPATAADAAALASVHVRAWQAAYRGIMPDPYLDALSVAERTAQWATTLAALPADKLLLVAERDGAVVGFAGGGPAAKPEDAGAGELYVLNVDPAAWGTGVGRALLSAVEGELTGRGFAEQVLWVASENQRARRFYERAGWRPDGVEADGEVLDVVVREARYRRGGIAPGREP